MLRILRDESLMARMGAPGRRLAEERYSGRLIGERMDGIYRELI